MEYSVWNYWVECVVLGIMVYALCLHIKPVNTIKKDLNLFCLTDPILVL